MQILYDGGSVHNIYRQFLSNFSISITDEKSKDLGCVLRQQNSSSSSETDLEQSSTVRNRFNVRMAKVSSFA